MSAHPAGLRVFVAAVALSAMGCREQVFEPVRDGLAASASLSGHVDVVTRADLLFVVDDSRSMQNEQQKLAQGFPALVQSLDALDPPVSWRVAVMTTSVDERFGPCNSSDPSSPALCSASFGGAGFACESGQCVRRFTDRAGKLLSSPGNPAVLDRDHLSASDLQWLFAQKVQFPLEGSRQEQPLRALQIALEGDSLSEFRRPDARLVVYIVSDEDDCSDGTEQTMALEITPGGEIDHCALGAATGNGLDDVGGWVRWFTAQGDVALGAVVGLTPNAQNPGQCVDASCASECTQPAGRTACEQQCQGALLLERCVGECMAECESFCGSQAPGQRLATAVRAVSGPLASICESDFGPALARLARVLGIPERIELSSIPGDLRAFFFQVTRQGRTLDCKQGSDWHIDLGANPPELVIEQAGACRLLPDDVWDIRYIATMD